MWLARDEQTGLDVALKIVPRQGKAAARAEREALAARRLRHQRCVRAYDVGHDQGHVYIAYEYVPGRTFREALRTDDVDDRGAVEIAAQVLDALAHAHRIGIVHRDVKPSNILLEHAAGIEAKLLDFGLAQFDGADTLTAVGDVPGTLAYIAPERLGGEEATPASDVWAVGVLLWEALAGSTRSGACRSRRSRSRSSAAPRISGRCRPDLPRRLLVAVDRALDPEPAARPHASTLAAELRAAFRQQEKRQPATRTPREHTSIEALPAVRKPLTQALPVVLAVATAAIGVTLLPFWPPVLAIAIVLGAAAGALLSPRLGMAIALAAPLFPFGNDARSAALVYGGFAVAWIALTWREARFGLLFAAGPLLAPLGALALVPLAVQPLRSAFLRGLQAAVAVLAAGLVAGLGEETGISPSASVADVGIGAVDRARGAARAPRGRGRRRGRRCTPPAHPAAAPIRCRSRRDRPRRGVGRGRRRRDRDAPRTRRLGRRSSARSRIPPVDSASGGQSPPYDTTRPEHERLHPSDAAMSVLRSLEARIEGLFEGIFGRAFRTHVQPIELARKLVKEMDDHRSVSVSRVYVPNEYTLYLSPQDRKQFEGYEDSLVGELQEYLAEHARREDYALLTPPRVLVTVDDDLAVGEFGIATRLVAAEDAPKPEIEVPVDQPAQTMIYKTPSPVPPAVRCPSRSRSPSPSRAGSSR